VKEAKCFITFIFSKLWALNCMVNVNNIKIWITISNFCTHDMIFFL
jgi:hypothetical protein